MRWLFDPCRELRTKHWIGFGLLAAVLVAGAAGSFRADRAHAKLFALAFFAIPVIAMTPLVLRAGFGSLQKQLLPLPLRERLLVVSPSIVVLLTMFLLADRVREWQAGYFLAFLPLIVLAARQHSYDLAQARGKAPRRTPEQS
ncbi:MAG TPA: hypothetical protein VKT78_09275 [Fimbriimonadaceae bacterium]|nr:hypothetical protein [Fimbriimonadaceae bacterium]